MTQIPTAHVRSLYQRLEGSNREFRARLARPLTWAEKILFLHLHDRHPRHGVDWERGETSALFDLDRVAVQDVTGQMVMLQFMLTGRDRSSVPATLHCDHLIRAHTGAVDDLASAHGENGEVFRFLADCAARYGVGFWKPGAGIIHQVILERYAFPAGMMIGTDSHTPNAGGLAMLGIGVGGADAVEVMAGLPWGMRMPRHIGIRLDGTPRGWTSGKDVILKVARLLTVEGGTGAVVEYFGPGTERLSTTSKSTITNMGAEIGATSSLFPYDEGMARYLRASGREELAALSEEFAHALRCDPEVEADPERFFDRVVEVDLDSLEPHLAGPHTPDLTRPVSEMRRDVASEGYPDEIAAALIGSCTNSSYEDMGRAAHVARQAADAGLSLSTPLLVTPGSESIHATIRRDGQMEALRRVGATVLANACGPCIGQWQRAAPDGEGRNSIITSYNRNFPRRNDGSAETHCFIGSPEMVTALAFAGRLSFDPQRDAIELPDGTKFRFEPPVAAELPARGLEDDPDLYAAPPADGRLASVRIEPQSLRLAPLAPFPAWDGRDFVDLPILLKAKGKCTTDQISPAGPWLRFRGHLGKISENLFRGATNAFTGEEGESHGRALHESARAWGAAGRRWVVFGDRNYGEGSSREHAAMSPRFLGCVAVIARSFARIHEANLKRHGVLPLTLLDPSGYDLAQEDDAVSVLGLSELAVDRPLRVALAHADRSRSDLECAHTLTPRQIEWFRAGSAVNWIRKHATEPREGG